MATIEGLTKDRMLAIEAASVTDGEIDPITGHLILTTHGGTEIDAGKARPDTFTDATETNKGVTTLATQAEVNAGTNDAEIVTPATLTGRIATQAETNTGTDTKKLLSPALLAGQLATQTEVNAGTDTKKLVTPATLKVKTDATIAASLLGAELPVGTDLNSLTTPGQYSLGTTAVVNSVKNWPSEAIPRADKADAYNPVASFRGGSTGILNVRLDSTGRVVQTAEVFCNLGGAAGAQPIGLFTFVWKRLYSAASTTWGPWILQSPPAGVTGWGELVTLAASNFYGACSYRSPGRVTYTFGGAQYPYQSVGAPTDYLTTDGVQWWREASQVRVGSNWTALPMSGGLVAYGANWPAPQALRTSAGIITMRGLGTVPAAPANGTTLLTLPPGMRPAMTHMFVVPGQNNTSGVLIRVEPDGSVRFISSSIGSGSQWLNFDLQWPAADVAPLSAWTPVTITTAQGWSDFAAGYPVPSYWQDKHGRVWFCGLVKRSASPGAADSQMFSIPIALKTNLQIHAITASSDGTCTAAIHWINSTFVYKAGNAGNQPNAWGWVSLSNIRVHPVANIPEGAWRNLTLQGGWIVYNTTFYPAPSVWAAPDGLMHCRGLAGSGNTGTAVQVASIGVNDRAVWASMAAISSPEAMKRADFSNTANNINFVTSSATWASFDGLTWFGEA